MEKKKTSRGVPPEETIHFRPGELAGRLIAKFGDDNGLSRGEAAKRLCALAVRGLDAECHAEIVELCSYAATDFDGAVQHTFVVITNLNAERQEAGEAQLSAVERRGIVTQVLGRHRTAYCLMLEEDEEKEKKKQVHIRLTDGT